MNGDQVNEESENRQPDEDNQQSPTGAEDANSRKTGFLPEVLDKTVITAPLFEEFRKQKKVYSIIIDVNLLYHAGREAAKGEVQRLVVDILKKFRDKKGQGIHTTKTKFSKQYVFAVLQEKVIKELVKTDRARENPDNKQPSSLQAVYHIWPDFEIQQLTTKSVSTVKADAARNVFAALGDNIYWAVMDSGIDENHLHFSKHQNLKFGSKDDPLQHRDFTTLSSELSLNKADDLSKNIEMKPDPNEKALQDEFGHGTHVAGIIAGEIENTSSEKIIATTLQRNEANVKTSVDVPIESKISGMAPRCKLVSLKVLDSQGRGNASNLIAAIEWIQEINGYGRRIRIQGVNMSVGYEFDPLWFACGQSPLCIEVNRLVKSGVVVVVAAGNTGYGYVQAQGKSMAVTAGLDLTINDPGNADLAITVGSTHREMPHVYGVSYFSSKGPTGDGRLKPDLVAPGEKIISCDSNQLRTRHGKEITVAKTGSQEITADNGNATKSEPKKAFYREDSGTSMAAPHVSGVIAAFLSVRTEFIGRPEEVKEIFLKTATDLKREKYFQGHGLVDLMRAIQSV